MNIFTQAECTIKKYTVEQAIQQAQTINREKGLKTCTNYVQRMNRDELITMERFSEIVDEIIGDSVFYNVGLEK